MDQATIEDLKQFIATTLSQQTSDLREDLDSLREDVQRLDHKIDDLSESVADALDRSNASTDQQLKDHGRRITRLEHKAA